MKNIFILFILVLIAGCSASTDTPQEENTETPPSISTPTSTVVGWVGVTPPSSVDKCGGIGGTIEMQILVGPAEAVGLEPLAVGSIPFSAVSGERIYLLQGSGPISYQDILEQEWGTYTVDLDLETEVTGECANGEENGMLNMTIEMSGEQFVEVIAQGFHGEYPWSGSHAINLNFPLVEGASAEGEGWRFVLHLNE